MSAVLPGSGQIYNKKYWKAPIAWAGIGTCVYFISDNRSAFRTLKADAISRQDDPNHISEITIGDLGTITGTKCQLAQIADDDQVLDAIDTRKQWLDLSYFALFAVYGLQVIDANVDGHLFDYDISPDLSLNVSPAFTTFNSPSAGLSFTINF